MIKYSKEDTEKEVAHFTEIAKSLVELKRKKAADYGNSWRVFGLLGIIMQIGSKFVRIWNINHGKKGEDDIMNEPLKDSFRDIAVYAIMGMQLIEMGKTDDAFSSFGHDTDGPNYAAADEEDSEDQRVGKKNTLGW